MKLNKLLIIAIAALFFTACTTEEDDSFTRHELVFQVSMGNQETRATTDGEWAEGDFIFVKVGEEVKQYKIISENGIPNAVGIDADNTFFWEDLGGSSVTVTAWSFGKKVVNSLNGPITIEGDQSKEENYYNNDFLYAPSTTISKAAIPQLTFYHQMARVNINIKCDEGATISKVEIGTLEMASPCIFKATFTEPTASADEDSDPNHGYFEMIEDEEGDGDDEEERVPVIPYQVSTVGGYDDSYSAILIPFPYESFGICITLEDGSQYSYIGGIYEYDVEGPYPFDPGTVNTFNITIKNKVLTVDGFVNEMGAPIDPVSVNDWRIHQ